MTKSKAVTVYAFGARVDFLVEKRIKPYKRYGEESIASEKFTIAQKYSQRSQLCWVAGEYDA